MTLLNLHHYMDSMIFTEEKSYNFVIFLKLYDKNL